MLETIATSGAPGSWTEITALVRPEALEAVSDILADFSGGGVATEPAIEALGPDEGYTLDMAAPLTVRAYAYGPVSRARRRALRRRLDAASVDDVLAAPLRYRTLSEQDWANAWKDHYDIEKAGHVVIRPAWIGYTPQAGEVVISLDPGMAFGTGQHPTTRMCLLGAQELLRPAVRVLDLGCGSGILAIAAARLGAGKCVAVDIEEQAVDATKANIALNGAAGSIEVILGSLDDVPAGKFGLIFANINAGTVIRLAPDLLPRLVEGGAMLAGGVIAEREGEVRQALTAAGLTVERVMAEGEWRTFVAKRP
ncbi:MAG TPA: 50S ribosomal protein L11 methyltransferase [Dehalococcoidia bacterium]